MSLQFQKYPRTPHLEGSRLQAGDEDLSQVAFSDIKGKHLVIEEKMDGSNCAVSFDADGTLRLQSRGHYLTSGSRDVHFDLFKLWATAHKDAFFKVLGARYIMYGEWLYAKHSVFYDALPAYFMEFDIFDRENGIYLDTPSRKALTDRMPVVPVLVLGEGKYKSKDEVISYLGKSHFMTEGHLDRLKSYCEENGLDAEEKLLETDGSNLMEGLYIKVEENGEVIGRLKYVRCGFLQATKVTPHHWLKSLIPNMLSVPFDRLFEE